MLAIDPGNPARVFMATTGGALGPTYYSDKVNDGTLVNTRCERLADEASLWVGDFTRFELNNGSAMANDGGIYFCDDGGKNESSWQMPTGLETLDPVNIAGMTGHGSRAALYFGCGDNNDFFTRDGGLHWGDPRYGSSLSTRSLHKRAADTAVPSTTWVPRSWSRTSCVEKCTSCIRRRPRGT